MAIQTRDVDLMELPAGASAQTSQQPESPPASRLEALGLRAEGMVHDVNNLLCIISGFAELALIATEEGEQPRKYISEVLKATHLASSFTRTFRDCGRQPESNLSRIDLNATASDLCGILSHTFAVHNIELAMDLEPELRPVLAIPGKLEQVLLNLALNACDAMPCGGRLTIQTSTASVHDPELPNPGKSFALVKMSDSGEGMTADATRQIFNPYFTSRLGGGNLGLGLAIVRQTVLQAGGAIDVVSEPGNGSTFFVYWPQENP